MQAFMPQKDTALTLAQAARSFISSCNAALSAGQAEGASCSGSTVAAAGPGGASAGGAAPVAEGVAAGAGGVVIPRFPLFAFADALPDEGFCACRILAPEREGREFFFPVELETRPADEAELPAADGGLPEAPAVSPSQVVTVNASQKAPVVNPSQVETDNASQGAVRGTRTIRLRIVFAELEGGMAGGTAPACGDVAGRTVRSAGDGTSAERQAALPELPQEYEYRERFPLCPRVFRTGLVEYSGCSWEVWDERWQTLPAR